MQCTPAINSVSPKHAKISRSQHLVKIFQHQRHGPPQNTRRDRPPQTQLKMGRTLHHHKSHMTRILSTDLHGRTRSPQLLEHRASSKVLPISYQRSPPGFQISIKKHDPSEFNSVTSQLSSLLKEMQGNPLKHSPLSKSEIFSVEYSRIGTTTITTTT